MALFLIGHRGLVDDGYITLSFARNLALHGEWAVTPGLLSNTATSPLHVLVLAAVTVVTRRPVMSLGFVLIASLAAAAMLTTFIARRYGWSWWAGPIVAVLLASSPLMASTLGLESFLLVALLLAVVNAVAYGRPGWVGAVCGLMVLARPDAGVFAVLAVVGLVAVIRPTGVAVFRTVLVPPAVALAVVAPWAAVSVWLFGTPIPDTLIWKTAQSQGLGGTYYGDAVPLFFEHWPAATALSVGLVVLGVAALLGWLAWAPLHPVTIVLGGGAVAHSAVMALLVVPPFTWYYAPTTACAALLVAFGLAALGRPSPAAERWYPHERRGRRTVISAARLTLLSGPVAALVAGCLAYAVSHDYAEQSSPFHANYATAQQYAVLADRVPARSVLQTSHGEVGALAYFCDCTVLDPLSDRGRLSPLIAEQLSGPGIRGALLRGLYAGWEPSEPVPARWQTVVSDHGTRVWSGFGGWGWLDIVPLDR